MCPLDSSFLGPIIDEKVVFPHFLGLSSSDKKNTEIKIFLNTAADLNSNYLSNFIHISNMKYLSFRIFVRKN